MAQFIPFAPLVEVNGQTVLTTVNAFPDYLENKAIEILKKNGIITPQPDKWYSQEAWLKTFEEISSIFGPNTLYNIGKKIPENAIFPPEIDSLEKALQSIDIAYHMNHKNGDIGFYKVVSHNSENQLIIMHCNNPYPCDFDRGIITTMARKFYPLVTVDLDKTRPSRKDGADDSWYIIKY